MRLIAGSILHQVSQHPVRNRIEADLSGPAPDLAALAGVHDVVVEGSRVSCSVDPDALPQVLGQLTAAGVRTLTSAPPTLEELFLDVYRPDGQDATT